MPAAREAFVCTSCGAADAAQVCGRCRNATYCDQDCQRKDWRVHKAMCIVRAAPPPPHGAVPALPSATVASIGLCRALIAARDGPGRVSPTQLKAVRDALQHVPDVNAAIHVRQSGTSMHAEQVLWHIALGGLPSPSNRKPAPLRAIPLLELLCSPARRGPPLDFSALSALDPTHEPWHLSALAVSIAVGDGKTAAWLLSHGASGTEPCLFVSSTPESLGAAYPPVATAAHCSGSSDWSHKLSPLLEELVIGGADVNARAQRYEAADGVDMFRQEDPAGKSALEKCISEKDSESALWLLSHGADPTCLASASRGDALSQSAQFGLTRVFEACLASLIARGGSLIPAPFFMPLGEGRAESVNYLTIAAERGHMGVIRAAAAGGVDLNTLEVGAAKKPPITVAAMSEQWETVELLADLGVATHLRGKGAWKGTVMDASLVRRWNSRAMAALHRAGARPADKLDTTGGQPASIALPRGTVGMWCTAEKIAAFRAAGFTVKTV